MQHIHPFTPAMIRLLKGPVEYLDTTPWELILTHQKELTNFLQQIGLLLVLDKDDGYAYVEQLRIDDEDNTIGWVRRTPLPYDESVLLVLLREMMAEFETGEATTRELIRKRRELKEYAELFFRENKSRVKFIRELDRLIDRVEQLGFLTMVEDHETPDEQRFRVKKIIKAKVDHEVLDNFKQQLSTYAGNAI
jgi:hypothetical protein